MLFRLIAGTGQRHGLAAILVDSLNRAIVNRALMPVASQNGTSAVLNSWKEIATFLNRGVRTVQRWERELSLPVHRIGRGKRAPVYAQVSELKFWMYASENFRSAQAPKHGSSGESGSAIQNSRRLIRATNDLVRRVAENTERQRRQTAEMEGRLLEMRSRYKNFRWQ